MQSWESYWKENRGRVEGEEVWEKCWCNYMNMVMEEKIGAVVVRIDGNGNASVEKEGTRWKDIFQNKEEYSLEDNDYYFRLDRLDGKDRIEYYFGKFLSKPVIEGLKKGKIEMEEGIFPLPIDMVVPEVEEGIVCGREEI